MIFAKVLLLRPVARKKCLLFFVRHPLTERIELFSVNIRKGVHELTDWNFQNLCLKVVFLIKDFWKF